jgi:hypothetical protein
MCCTVVECVVSVLVVLQAGHSCCLKLVHLAARCSLLSQNFLQVCYPQTDAPTAHLSSMQQQTQFALLMHRPRKVISLTATLNVCLSLLCLTSAGHRPHGRYPSL